MIPYSEALDILKLVARKSWMPACAGMTIGNDIVAPENFPAFCNSMMDGFLLRAPAKVGRYKLSGQVAAGSKSLDPGDDEAIEIMTGAPINFTGHEGVIRLEDVVRVGNEIEIQKPVSVAENVRMAGSDIEIGQIVIPSGTRIKPQHMMVLAALGIEINFRPRVAIVATGNELANGQIRNSSGAFLQASLTSLGAEILNLGICPDDVDRFDQLLTSAIEWKADIIVSTGAVSVGAFDFVRHALERREAKIHFHGVAIRPGKPILCAQLGETMFFGLPGNPMATVVGFEFFVKPYMGIQEAMRYATLQRDFKKPKELQLFCTAMLTGDEIDILDKQASYGVMRFAQANAWAILPADVEWVRSGTRVEVREIG